MGLSQTSLAAAGGGVSGTSLVFAATKPRPPPILAAVVLGFTNYDLRPPSVTFADPFTRQSIPAKLLQLHMLRRMAIPGATHETMALAQQGGVQVQFNSLEDAPFRRDLGPRIEANRALPDPDPSPRGERTTFIVGRTRMNRIADVTTLSVPRNRADELHAHLRKVGREGHEALGLWAGRQTGHHFQVHRTVIPAQTPHPYP
ncbi:hypothetical protein ACVWW4_003828 [Bradyrhizobium sp. LB7.1]